MELKWTEIFIVVVWTLEVDASGSRFMLSSVDPCLGELWSFPDELFVIGYLVVSCSLVLNDQVFYSNCELFQYNLNFVECYYSVKIYFHMVYFDFGTVLSLSFYTVLDSIVYYYHFYCTNFSKIDYYRRIFVKKKLLLLFL